LTADWSLAGDRKLERRRTISHQKRPRQNATNANENTAKSTNLVDILPLITVWLQAQVRANHLRYQWLITFAAVRASPQAPEIRRSYYPE
jgi:hypothetical protein